MVLPDYDRYTTFVRTPASDSYPPLYIRVLGTLGGSSQGIRIAGGWFARYSRGGGTRFTMISASSAHKFHASGACDLDGVGWAGKKQLLLV